MANQEEKTKLAQQSQQEQDRKRRFDDCTKEIETVKAEIKNIIDDISNARKKGEFTGALFAEKQRLEEKLRNLEKECERNRGTGQAVGPDLKKNQFIISSSSVKRKIAEQLVRKDPRIDKQS